MLLREVMLTDFLLVPADATIGRLKNFSAAFQPAYVIIQTKKGYYLLHANDVEILAHESEESQSLEFAVGDRFEMSPGVDAFVGADEAPDKCVVIDDDGGVIGLFDVARGDVLNIIRGDGKPSEHEILGPYHLCADFPEKIGVGQTASLLLHISKSALFGQDLELALRKGETIEALIRARNGLAVEGTGEGILTITDEDDPLPIRFKLRGKKSGIARIDIFAFCKGQPLGKISLSPRVVEMKETDEIFREEVSEKLAVTYPSQADLTLLIFESGEKHEPVLNFRLTAAEPSMGYNFTGFNPVRLKTDPAQYFRELFADIENLSLKTAKDREVAEFRLERKGNLLFEQLIPDDLKPVLWSLQSHIRSVQILSEEAWIPWELCKLQGKDGNGTVDGPFFCEAFAMTRWMPGISRKPALKLNRIGLVVPGDSGLKEATNEKQFIMSLADANRKVDIIPAETLEVAKAMKSGNYDCWHFSGHGVAHHTEPNRSRILLEKREVLYPEDISGAVCNLGKAHPMVFLNACQTGRGAFSLTHMGGWAARFLKAGAAAFVGTHWSVYDESASQFCETFYDRILNGTTVGEAAREARLSIRKPGEPTWLAYTVFGDPVACVKRSSLIV